MASLGRRRFLAVTGTLLASPVVDAQQAKRRWRLGFLSLDTAASEAGRQALELFPAALAKLGYREGADIEFEWRWADGNTSELAGLATGLVRIPVDIIVARTNARIVAAKNATRSIPIVMLNGNFPVETGLVASLARPGGNNTALDSIASSGADAVFYRGAPVLRTRTQLMAFLRDRKLPSIATIPTFAEAGGLIHYAPDVQEYYDQTASYVDRILKGARAADLPVQQPTKFELVINLKTARAIGVTIPSAILVRADRVIE